MVVVILYADIQTSAQDRNAINWWGVVDVHLLVKGNQLRPRTRLSTFGVIPLLGFSRGHTGTSADDIYAVGVSGIFKLVILVIPLTNGWGKCSQPRRGVDCAHLVNYPCLFRS